MAVRLKCLPLSCCVSWQTVWSLLQQLGPEAKEIEKGHLKIDVSMYTLVSTFGTQSSNLLHFHESWWYHSSQNSFLNVNQGFIPLGCCTSWTARSTLLLLIKSPQQMLPEEQKSELLMPDTAIQIKCTIIQGNDSTHNNLFCEHWWAVMGRWWLSLGKKCLQ